MGIDVAVAGATGAVGAEMLSALERRDFPVGRLYPLASARSAGKKVRFRGEDLPVGDLARFDFSYARIALFSAGSEVSKRYAPIAGDAGCVVIDNSSCFRYDEDVPLVVPEVNPDDIAGYSARNLVANPNCSTIQMVVVLNPLHRAATIKRLNVATYQSVSGAGAAAMRELERQAREQMDGKAPSCKAVFPCPVAFNAIPHIDAFQDNGYTREEMKMVWETRKIMGDDGIMVNSTAVRIPVFVGHSEAINIETERKLGADEAKRLLAEAEGVKVVDERAAEGYPTPLTHGAGTDEVLVGRIREDISHPSALNLWVVSDNLRKGAALNAVQIAGLLLKKL